MDAADIRTNPDAQIVM